MWECQLLFCSLGIYQKIPFTLVSGNSHQFEITVTSCSVSFLQQKNSKNCVEQRRKGTLQWNCSIKYLRIKNRSHPHMQKRCTHLFIQKPGM